jgi:hypothetical protein
LYEGKEQIMMFTEGMYMGPFDWMDLNRDGKIDGAEFMFGEEMLCTSKEEHKALFGDSGDWDDDSDDDLDDDDY